MSHLATTVVSEIATAHLIRFVLTADAEIQAVHLNQIVCALENAIVHAVPTVTVNQIRCAATGSADIRIALMTATVYVTHNQRQLQPPRLRRHQEQLMNRPSREPVWPRQHLLA